MQHNPQAFRLIANLLAAWEKEGYAVGVETQLQLRELTQKLPDDINIQNLKTLLAPLFANSRDEQEQFYELFDKNLKENEQFFTETANYVQPSIPVAPPSVQNRFKWLFGILGLVLLIILGYFFYKNYSKKPLIPKKEIVIKYEDLNISTKDKGEHELYFNQYDTLDSKIKSITNICPEKTNKNVRITIKNAKQLFYEAISKGIDTVCIQFCFENRANCDTTYYRFIVDDFEKPDSGVLTPSDTLAFKPYKHTPDISSLIPIEKMRFGSRFAYWDWTKTFIFLGILTAILALGKWLNRRKQLIFKDLKGNDKAPYAWTVKIDGADKIGLNDIFYTASNQLRRRSDNEISRFDVPRTVTATIKQAGRVNFQYRQLTQSNEYLLLIDMPSAANHQAQLFNFLNKALSDNEVLIDRFFYDGDIRLCWNETYKRGISLKDLQHHYSEHRLIIVGSGHSFLSPLNGKLAKWATIFDHWRIKALFSTRPASEWDMRESQLAQKFRILPASLKGIGELVETIEAVEAKDYRLWKTIKDPSVQPLRLPDSLTDDELMTVLKAEFMRYNNRQADDRLVQWIAACAVYPTMHWDLTLALGATLGVTSSQSESLVNLDNLFTINRLSWFVDGKMPEAVRKTLLKWLSETHPSVLEQTRKHLAEILKNCQPPSDSIAYEDYRLQMVMNELLLKPNPRQRKALETELEKLLALDAEQDFLVAEYLNRPRTPLDFVVPVNLRKYVRVQETNRLPRTPQWVWQLLIAVPALICLWFFNPKSIDCFHLEVVKNQFYCVQTPQDSLILYEHILCDNLDSFANDKKIRLRKEIDSLVYIQNNGLAVQYGTTADEIQKKVFPLNNFYSSLAGYDLSENEAIEKSFQLIRRYRLDSVSFYRNIPLAYWNAAVKYFNNGKIDSACIYFNKLDKWAWRDSVLTPEEVAFIGKTCYPEIAQQQQQNIAPPPQQLQDRDFEPYQTRKQYGFRNSKTQETLIPPQYQNAYYFAERLAAVKVGTKWGFIDRNNNMVIPPQYDNVSQNFRNGRAQVQVGKETFFIDKKGKPITQSPIQRQPIQQPPTNPQPNPRASSDTAKNIPIDTRQMPSVPSDTGKNIAAQTALPNSKNKPIEGEMIYVLGRNFQMGCDEKRDAPCQENERPQHPVTLSSYNIGKYEVTNEEYVIFLNDNGNDYKIDEPFKGEKLIYENKWGIAFHSQGDITTAYYEVQKGYEKYPVVGVTWYGAVAYCEWLSKKTGLKYRLPTEAEWEYAARGGDKSRQYTYSGSNKIGDVAWYAANSNSRTHSTGTKAANELGIYDMSGNVWEWCSDQYEVNYYKGSPTRNPQGGLGNNRILRGGSAYSLYNICRNAMRNSMAPSSSNDYFGFRLVLGY